MQRRGEPLLSPKGLAAPVALALVVAIAGRLGLGQGDRARGELPFEQACACRAPCRSYALMETLAPGSGTLIPSSKRPGS